MKKLILTTGLAALIGASSISSVSAEGSAFSGMYGGVQAGFQQQKFKSKSTINNRHHTVKQNSLPFGFNFGMSTVSANNIFLAGQVDMNFSLTSRIKTYTPGITAKVGYRFGDKFVLAATAGGVFSNIHYHGSTKNRFGYRPGIEAMFAVNEKNIFGASYEYTKTNSFHHAGWKVKPVTNAVMAKYTRKF